MDKPVLCTQKECTGCGACKSVCPVGAIKMQYDEYGFYKPQIDDIKCIKCGRCENVCPKLGRTEVEKSIQKAYAFINKDGFLLQKSASGGVYPIIARQFMNEGGRVFAAVYQDDLKVQIQEIHGLGEIELGCGSKYVQSQTGDSFRQVKEILNRDEKVLYFGLPCQLAGLYRFLGKEYKNLYTVDLVCHGVPSEKLFQLYVAYMEKELGSKIISIDHRYKRGKFEKIVAITLRISTEDGRTIVKDSADDPYLLAFRLGISLGSQCTECSFSSLERVGDLTMGDFLCLGTVNSFKEDISKGVSTVLVNTEKGRELLESIADKSYIEERELKECLVFNTNLWKRTKKHSLYDEFYSNLFQKNLDFGDIRKKYLDQNPRNILIKNVKKVARKVFGTEGICKYMYYTAQKDGTIRKIEILLENRDA